MQYMALKFDMVRSRRLRGRDEVQKQFLATVADINRQFRACLAADFVVTHGDEAQVLLGAQQGRWAFQLFEHLVFSMRGVEFRCGIGWGTLSTALQPLSIGMDGEAWQNAQKALDKAKKGRLIISFSGFNPELEFQLNALGNLLCHVQARWSGEQLETILLLSRLGKQRVVAAKLGISEAAVSKQLTAAGWHHYSRGRAALERLLVKATGD